ncbi:O20/O137 family O-antigen polymerase, partial [Escherichia coli]|nr:O20/O137 family O-antigen polymerase [Escherichia coli]
MNWKIKKNVELLILFLVLNQLVIDTFNGYFIFSSQGGGNISVIYKIIIFFLFLFYELVSRDRFIVAFSIVTWGVFLTFFHLLSNNYTEVVMDLSEYIKLATTFIVFLGVSK